MYLPNSFRSDDRELALRVMREYPFATIITCPNGQAEISHVPVVHDAGALRFHVARANPQSSQLSAGAAVLAIFHGPHAYVSPSWYASPEAVPTWNYVVVHARGVAKELKESELRALLDTLTLAHEATTQPPLIDQLIPAIVGFEVPIDRLETKLKLSQNKSADDQRRVAEALARSNDQTEREVAAWMQRAAFSKSAGPLRASYDTIASAYAQHFSNELDHKPFDRRWLDDFASLTRGRGRVGDFGCGPGHISAYLSGRGCQVLGIDLSPQMIAEAKQRHPELDFVAADMRALDLPDSSLAGAIAPYAIVHFSDDELAAALREIRRVLQPGAPLFLSFHVGSQIKHVDELLGHAVSIDFRFFETDIVTRALQRAGFTIDDVAVRPPYDGVEYPSTRAYVRSCSAVSY